jgi:AcrR family transcriptional regulator
VTIWVDRAVRYENGEERPLGPRGERTRDRILAAAVQVLGEQGYAATTMADVAGRAGVSIGTLYQYFRDRSDLVVALVRRAVRDLRRTADVSWRMDEGLAGIERVIANYLRGYVRSPGMAKVWEEVTFLEGELLELRRELGHAFTAPVERELRRALEAGEIDPAIDPAIAAVALSGMVDRWCFVTYVLDPPTPLPDPDRAATVLARLWVGGLQADWRQ